MAGPVGFEPTILGSEGPRLGPGSTTGPARSFLARQLLLFSMTRGFRRPAVAKAEFVDGSLVFIQLGEEIPQPKSVSLYARSLYIH